MTMKRTANDKVEISKQWNYSICAFKETERTYFNGLEAHIISHARINTRKEESK